MSQWHYQKNNKTFGPISGTVLKNLADRGQILPTDLVRKEGTDDWRPANEAKGLFAPVPAAVASAGPEDSPKGIGAIGVLSIMIGLASILVGAAAIAAYFTPYGGFTVLLAMAALVSGATTLLLDWI